MKSSLDCAFAQVRNSSCLIPRLGLYFIVISAMLAGCTQSVPAAVTATVTATFPPEPATSTPVEPSPTATVTAAPPIVDLEAARARYPHEVTAALVSGAIPAPEGFEDCVTVSIGQERLASYRSGPAVVEGRDNDAAALCLMQLNMPPEALVAGAAASGPPLSGSPNEISVEFTKATYPVASGNTSGFFKTAQAADLMLAGVGFNNTGGPLLFNRPGGIATDGTHLLLADTFNNRVLIWNTLPDGNVPPDLVLGQTDFTSNNPGTKRDQMNWPRSIVTDGTRIVVADTNNDRLLIWNRFPLENGTPADIILQSGIIVGPQSEANRMRFAWPWGLWTDGRKLAVSSTRTGAVLIWNQFPTQDDEPPDIRLTAGGEMGTPRQITSDGRSLMVGDHSASVEGAPDAGSFVWKTFPTADEQPYDFFMPDPGQPGGPWLRGGFAADGRLIAMGSTLYVWDSLPQGASDDPALSISNFDFSAGDSVDVAIAGNRLYINSGNSNKVLVYRTIPTNPGQLPDFALGSPDININTLETNYFVTNPVPVSDGRSVFVSSDFDRKLYVWRKRPNSSGSYPDLVYTLGFQPMDNALWGDTLVLAGEQGVIIWDRLPLDGNLPDRTFHLKIGQVQLGDLRGVALDDRYFYLADSKANKVYVWEGIPSETSAPVMSLDVNNPQRLSSDGNYLAVTTTFDHSVLIYPLSQLSEATPPIKLGGAGQLNLPLDSTLAGGHLFIVDSGMNRVLAWPDVESALSGGQADAILGTNDDRPEIGPNKLFSPGSVFFDGDYLWVGEYKFSGRLLRYSPSP